MNENDWPVSVLWTREATFPFYQNSGYEPVGPQARGYPLSPSEYETFERGSYDISLYNPSNPEHLDAVIRIHEVEPLRIGRTRDDYAHYFNLHKMSTLLAHRERSHRGVPDAGAREEQAGLRGGRRRRRGAGGAVPPGARAGYRGRFRFRRGAAHPTTFGDVLEARKPGTAVLDTESDIGFQMMRVNSLSSLISKITGHLRRAERGGRRGDGLPRVRGRRRRCDDHPAEWGRGGLDGTLRTAGRADAQGAYEAHLRAASGGRTGHGRRGSGERCWTRSSRSTSRCGSSTTRRGGRRGYGFPPTRE